MTHWMINDALDGNDSMKAMFYENMEIGAFVFTIFNEEHRLGTPRGIVYIYAS